MGREEGKKQGEGRNGGKGEEERRNSTGRGGEEEEFEPGLKEATGGGPASSSLSSSIPTPLPLPARPTRFRMEKRVTSGGLVLRNEQPVAAVQYRRLLDIMVREKGRKSGYCFVKEKRHKVGSEGRRERGSEGGSEEAREGRFLFPLSVKLWVIHVIP